MLFFPWVTILGTPNTSLTMLYQQHMQIISAHQNCGPLIMSRYMKPPSENMEALPYQALAEMEDGEGLHAIADGSRAFLHKLTRLRVLDILQILLQLVSEQARRATYLISSGMRVLRCSYVSSRLALLGTQPRLFVMRQTWVSWNSKRLVQWQQKTHLRCYWSFSCSQTSSWTRMPPSQGRHRLARYNLRPMPDPRMCCRRHAAQTGLINEINWHQCTEMHECVCMWTTITHSPHPQIW